MLGCTLWVFTRRCHRRLASSGLWGGGVTGWGGRLVVWITWAVHTAAQHALHERVMMRCGALCMKHQTKRNTQQNTHNNTHNNTHQQTTNTAHLPPRSHAVINALSVNASGRNPLPTMASSRATASSRWPALAAALMSVLKVIAFGAARALPEAWWRCMMRKASLARSAWRDGVGAAQHECGKGNGLCEVYRDIVYTA